MSLFVVDASVGVKWFVPEVHSDAAQRLQDPAHELHVWNAVGGGDHPGTRFTMSRHAQHFLCP